MSPTRATAVYAMAPVLALQGTWVRLKTPILPGSSGRAHGTVPGQGEPIRLLALGESTVAGVGAPTHNLGLAARSAEALQAASGRTVHWQAIGQIGVTAAAARRALVPRIPDDPVDVLVIALGVNDTMRLTPQRKWVRDLRGLIDDVRAVVGPARVALSPVPPMERFPSLPQPLRWALGTRAAHLDAGVRALAEQVEHAAHLHGEFEDDEALFCRDRFHPSPLGYARWGAHIGEWIADWFDPA